MALFKPNHGNRDNLPEQLTEGWGYVSVDDAGLFFDVPKDGDVVRLEMNPKESEKYTYANTESGLNAETVQEALDELAINKLNDAPSDSATYGRNNGSWVAVGTSQIHLPYDAVNKYHIINQRVPALGRNNFVFTFENYGNNGGLEIKIYDSVSQQYYYCMDLTGSKLYNWQLPWNGDGVHIVYSRLGNFAWTDGETPVDGYFEIESLFSIPGANWATEEEAKAGARDDAGITPYTLNAAMSKFGGFGVSASIGSASGYTSFDELKTVGKFLVKWDANLENDPFEWQTKQLSVYGSEWDAVQVVFGTKGRAAMRARYFGETDFVWDNWSYFVIQPPRDNYTYGFHNGEWIRIPEMNSTHLFSDGWSDTQSESGIVTSTTEWRTITFDNPFDGVPVITANPVGTTLSRYVQLSSITAESFQFRVITFSVSSSSLTSTITSGVSVNYIAVYNGG